MFCETGVIGEIKKHGIAMIEARNQNEISYLKDTYCEQDISFTN